MRKTHYDVLEVIETASPETIRGAHKHLVQKWHPDRSKGDQGLAARMTTALNEAAHVLSDPARRRAYDQQLANERAARQPPPPPPRPEPTPAPAPPTPPPRAASPPSDARTSKPKRKRLPPAVYWVGLWLVAGAVLVGTRLEAFNGTWALVMLGLCGAVMLIVKSSKVAPGGKTVAWTAAVMIVLASIGRLMPFTATAAPSQAWTAPATKAPVTKAPESRKPAPKKPPVASTPTPKPTPARITAPAPAEPRASSRVDSDAAAGIDQPDYPRAAWLDGREGTAIVRVTVSAHGTTSSRLLRSSGQPDLDAAALRARPVVYSVGWRNGRRASTQVDVPVAFRSAGH